MSLSPAGLYPQREESNARNHTVSILLSYNVDIILVYGFCYVKRYAAYVPCSSPSACPALSLPLLIVAYFITLVIHVFVEHYKL